MTSSPLDLFNQQLVLLAVPLLCVFVAGAIAVVLIHAFGKQFVQFLRGLPRLWRPRKTQVLIVEDNPGSREMLEEYLRDGDYEVTAARNLRTAIHFFKKKRFDAIISDI